jgi:hypothetical protein
MAAMILRRRHADAAVAARPDADVPDRRPGVFSGSTPMEAILMRIRFPAFIPAATLALSAFAPTLPAATFSVGPGATCTHNSLQAALDSAANNSGADVVRVVRTATWTGIQVSTDTGQDVGQRIFIKFQAKAFKRSFVQPAPRDINRTCYDDEVQDLRPEQRSIEGDKETTCD